MTALSERDFMGICERYLSPFLDLLLLQQQEMHAEPWFQAVNRFQLSVQRNPEQYLGKDLPSKEDTDLLLSQFFEAFHRKHSSEPTRAKHLQD